MNHMNLMPLTINVHTLAYFFLYSRGLFRVSFET
jgi:hypothetical protein